MTPIGKVLEFVLTLLLFFKYPSTGFWISNVGTLGSVVMRYTSIDEIVSSFPHSVFVFS